MPDTHRHLHNNGLNIAVETGWLGIFAWAWWMLALVLAGAKHYLSQAKNGNFLTHIFSFLRSKDYRNRELLGCELTTLMLASSAALFGWQLAGLVEFNFGDSEIRLLAYLVIGFLLAATSKLNRTPEESFSGTKT